MKLPLIHHRNGNVLHLEAVNYWTSPIDPQISFGYSKMNIFPSGISLKICCFIQASFETQSSQLLWNIASFLSVMHKASY